MFCIDLVELYSVWDFNFLFFAFRFLSLSFRTRLGFIFKDILFDIKVRIQGRWKWNLFASVFVFYVEFRSDLHTAHEASVLIIENFYLFYVIIDAQFCF